jgi:hypothetical protein
MGGDSHQSGAGTIATFFLVVIGTPLILLGCLAVVVAIGAAVVGPWL